ncbi:hypothetical protein Unana1_03177 [Umbelopsis nana]
MDDSVSQFLQYLVQTEHVDLSKVTVNYSKESGNGLYATTDFSRDNGELIATIPSRLIVTANSALAYLNEYNTALYNDLSRLPKDCKDFERYCLNLFLISDKNASRATPWKFYTNIFPSLDTLKETHPLFYGDVYMKILEGTSLHTSIIARQESTARELGELKAQVPSANEISLDDWQWADTVFWTRVVSMKSQAQSKEESGEEASYYTQDYALVPLLDFANHSMSPNLRWEVDKEGNFQLLTHRKPQDKALEHPDLRSGKTGKQLFFSYGEKSNQELLFLHGFCVSGNQIPANVTLSAIPFMTIDEETADLKMAWLQQIGASHTLTLMEENQKKRHEHEDHPLLKAGLTLRSVELLTLCMLDMDGPVDFITEHEKITLHFDGQPQANLTELFNAVEHHWLKPIYRLRTVLTICPAFEYNLDTISEVEKLAAPGSRLVDTTMGHIVDYALQEGRMLEKAVTVLHNCQNELGRDPIILQYISQQQAQEED